MTTVFMLNPSRKSVTPLVSFEDVWEADEYARLLIRLYPNQEEFTFGSFPSVEMALSVCVWIAVGKFLWPVSYQ